MTHGFDSKEVPMLHPCKHGNKTFPRQRYVSQVTFDINVQKEKKNSLLKDKTFHADT